MSKSSERKFYFLEVERNRLPRGRKVPKRMTLGVHLAELKESTNDVVRCLCHKLLLEGLKVSVASRQISLRDLFK